MFTGEDLLGVTPLRLNFLARGLSVFSEVYNVILLCQSIVLLGLSRITVRMRACSIYVEVPCTHFQIWRAKMNVIELELELELHESGISLVASFPTQFSHFI